MRAPVAFTTFAHLGISRAMCLANASGVPPATVAPSLARRARS
jgi:hypothetical protein